jgi:fibronectin type 3 domain-containing protein
MVLDPDFNVVALTGNDGRQALASFEPTRPGLYQVRVNSFNGGGPYWLDVSGAIERPMPPAAPTNLATTVVSRTQINLTWTDNSGGESGFVIFRRDGANDFDRIAVVDRDTTSYADLELEPNTRYTYRVRAIGPHGSSAWSNPASGTTLPITPVAPGGLLLNVVAYNQINVTWTDNSDNESGFSLFRKSGAGDFVRIASFSANTTSFTDTGLTQNTTYTYRVRAFNEGGTSGWSNEATDSTPSAVPAAPTNLAATAMSVSQISLSWTDNSNNETAFSIFRKDGAGDFVRVAVVTANSATFMDSGLTAGTQYTYRVRAANDVAASAFTNDATATTMP